MMERTKVPLGRVPGAVSVREFVLTFHIGHGLFLRAVFVEESPEETEKRERTIPHISLLSGSAFQGPLPHCIYGEPFCVGFF